VFEKEEIKVALSGFQTLTGLEKQGIIKSMMTLET